ncbi:MAG TPA: TIGR03915 family putative DNA repair protein [Spirochaetota bacterium]|nr:TIGR03915 family putative DNA repair protein [Spirochaetota bacterium]
MIIKYDGSFTGLLTVIYEGLKNNLEPENIITSDNNEEIDLFSDIIFFNSDKKKADIVIKTIKKKLNFSVLKVIYYAYLSNEDNIEIDIYNYLKLCFQYNKDVYDNLGNDYINKLAKAVRRVQLEKHRFLGFVRFELLKDGIYYSKIEPDNNIIYLIVDHFKNRFRDQKWLIHDTLRNIAAYYDKNSLRIFDIYNIENLEYDQEEMEFRHLWKTYFKNIAITERRNLRLQRNFMPVRYWKNLIEIDKK